ncbi:MAG TPA: IS110 family transposase [Nocardioidaceae bacterium]|nr:IS110 family transposase [Nocardioidaceae bacterium]
MTIMIGIDPHKATHTAVAMDSDEKVLDEFKLRASNVQAQRLRSWAEQFEQPQWAVESAHGLGYLVAQQLVAAGETVFDVPPVLASRVRVLGSGRSQKNDPNDARAVAIAVLRSDRLQRVVPDDHARVLRLLVKRHRDMAQLRAKHCTRLHALLLELEAGGISSSMTVNKANRLLEGITVADEVTRHRVLIAHELVEDIARLDTTLKASKQRITVAVAASGTSLCEVYGIGPICAATIIGYTGDVGRFATKGHFATYNATAPLEVSSGERIRHRLNLRGNRKLNHAIHIAAICQIRCDSEGRAYYDRKIADGKTHKEAVRALKRRISDRVYQRLVADARRTRTT